MFLCVGAGELQAVLAMESWSLCPSTNKWGDGAASPTSTGTSPMDWGGVPGLSAG